MRQTFKYIIWATVMVAFLVSCNKDKDEIVEEFRPVNKDFLIAGYIPYYSFDRFDLDALKKLHRVYYFSVAPDTEGNFVYSAADVSNLQTLTNNFTGESKEVFLVIGGWYESENIHAMAEDESKRKKYAEDIADFCEEHDLDGVDLDWESYPQKVNDANYISFVKELYTELHPRNLKFTIAVAVSHAQRTAGLLDYVDQINVMSYGILDENGNQATFAQMLEWLALYKQNNIPSEMIIYGVPFYGKRPYDAEDTSPRAITYRSIVGEISPSSGMNKHGKYGFNGRTLMKDKTRYLMENNYGGIMSWELTQDVEVASDFSLLKAIYEEYSFLINSSQ